ncbi:MAG TPA: serralysin [Porticoccaceae bacterium]|nr:serralysin [Porticoccaceae bacterium]|tara:strand:- start:686 stop:1654 length:969 start_codon:yes stop_codon:yes gene_type:complete
MFPIIKNLVDNADSSSLLKALYRREMPQPDSSLYEAAAYHFNSPGKAFRAQLALSSGHALKLNAVDNLNWAAACELLHNASLIHDDISDASTHRRGQKSIHAQFGGDMALCLGDWMVAKAFALAGRNSRYAAPLVVILAEAMQSTCSGQMSDIKQRQCASIYDWECIASGKTTPLLIAPIKGATIAAGLHTELISLERLVSLCGLVYQGRNDIDDIVPSSHRSSDLDGRKPNLVVSLFSENLTSNDDFTRWYNSDNTGRVGHWQRRIAASDAIVQANDAIDYWLVKATGLLPSIPEPLRGVAQDLVFSVRQTVGTKRQGQIA